jgi:multicomponent Na+:H+ antiporter subunit B
VLYAGVGLAGILLGGNFLDYSVLAADPVRGQLRGILLVEAGVGMTVAGVMLKIFYMFAGRGEAQR